MGKNNDYLYSSYNDDFESSDILNHIEYVQHFW